MSTIHLRQTGWCARSAEADRRFGIAFGGLRQQAGDGDIEGGGVSEGEADGLGFCEGFGEFVAAGAGKGVSVFFDGSVDEIDDDVLGDGGVGVDAQLGGAVVLEGTVGDFDDANHISRSGVAVAVAIVRACDDCRIRFGFAVGGNCDGLLESQIAPVLRNLALELAQLPDCPRVMMSHRHRISSCLAAVFADEIAIEQFDWCAFGQDPRCDHAVVLIQIQWHDHGTVIDKISKPGCRHNSTLSPLYSDYCYYTPRLLESTGM